jgi:hypothetical protein
MPVGCRVTARVSECLTAGVTNASALGFWSHTRRSNACRPGAADARFAPPSPRLRRCQRVSTTRRCAWLRRARHRQPRATACCRLIGQVEDGAMSERPTFIMLSYASDQKHEVMPTMLSRTYRPWLAVLAAGTETERSWRVETQARTLKPSSSHWKLAYLA